MLAATLISLLTAAQLSPPTPPESPSPPPTTECASAVGGMAAAQYSSISTRMCRAELWCSDTVALSTSKAGRVEAIASAATGPSSAFDAELLQHSVAMCLATEAAHVDVSLTRLVPPSPPPAAPPPPPPRNPGENPPSLPPSPATPCELWPGCLRSRCDADGNAECIECYKDGWTMAASGGTCQQCAALPECTGETWCSVGDDGAVGESVCADATVWFDVVHWHDLVETPFLHVCGDFNGWCNTFSEVGKDASHQWRLTKQDGPAPDDAECVAWSGSEQTCSQYWSGEFKM